MHRFLVDFLRRATNLSNLNLEIDINLNSAEDFDYFVESVASIPEETRDLHHASIVLLKIDNMGLDQQKLIQFKNFLIKAVKLGQRQLSHCALSVGLDKPEVLTTALEMKLPIEKLVLFGEEPNAGCPQFVDALEVFLPQMPTLKCITLQDIYPKQSSRRLAQVLSSYIAEHSNITELNLLMESSFKRPDRILFYQNLARNKSITSLFVESFELRGNTEETLLESKAFCQMLANCNMLASFTLRFCGFPDEMLQNIFNILSQKPSLKILNCCSVYDAADQSNDPASEQRKAKILQGIAKVLKSNPQLTDVILKQGYIFTSKTLQILRSGFLDHPNLKNLQLSSLEFGDEPESTEFDVKQFSEIIQGLSKLHSLSLTDFVMMDQDIKSLFESLAKHPTMEHFQTHIEFIERSGVADEAMAHLIATNKKLRKLELNLNKDVIASISQALAANRSLTHLSLAIEDPVKFLLQGCGSTVLQALRKNNQLEEITVRGRPLNDNGEEEQDAKLAFESLKNALSEIAERNRYLKRTAFLTGFHRRYGANSNLQKLNGSNHKPIAAHILSYAGVLDPNSMLLNAFNNSKHMKDSSSLNVDQGVPTVDQHYDGENPSKRRKVGE